MSSGTSHKPLRKLRIVEWFSTNTTDTGRAAISFAGLIAARFGATVLRLEESAQDPMRKWPPILANGESTAYKFLTSGKRNIKSGGEIEPGDFLLTDDSELAEAWPDKRKVLIKPSFGHLATQPQTDITAMALSGLLDIFGEVGRPPVPFPGFQIAYATGMAAYCVLLSQYISQSFGRAPVGGEVALVDIAKWINWKNLLSHISKERDTGIGRAEEWIVVKCKDGFIAPIFRDRDMNNLAKITGKTELSGPRFATSVARRENIADLHALIKEGFAERDAKSIIDEAEIFKLPFAEVRSPSQLLDDPQVLHRQFIIDTADGLQPRLPLLWDDQAVESLSTNLKEDVC